MERIEYQQGTKFPDTYLTFITEVAKTTPKKRRALFACDCGVKIESNICHVSNKRTISCGCVHRERTRKANTRHGQANRGNASGAYRSWQSMHERAGIKEGYLHISICTEWDNFENFYADMGDRPVGYSIERVNNLGNYEPGNCIWADDVTQASNRSTNMHVIISGVRNTVSEWCRQYGISRFTVNSRLRSGMGAVDAITTPLLRKRK